MIARNVRFFFFFFFFRVTRELYGDKVEDDRYVEPGKSLSWKQKVTRWLKYKLLRIHRDTTVEYDD